MNTILVVGPLPLLRRSLRLPLGVVLGGVFALLLAGAAGGLLTLRLRPTPIDALAAQLPITLPGQAPIPTPAVPGIPVRVASIPVGITILLEGQALGTTPATVAVPPGRSLILRRMGAADVTVLDPRADVVIPVWPAATVLPVRAPLPGGALTDLQVLADGRLALAVASAAAPTERQAWLLDPTRAHFERVGPTTRDNTPPAGTSSSPLAPPPTMQSPGSPAHRARCATPFSPPWSRLRATMPSGARAPARAGARHKTEPGGRRWRT